MRRARWRANSTTSGPESTSATPRRSRACSWTSAPRTRRPCGRGCSDREAGRPPARARSPPRWGAGRHRWCLHEETDLMKTRLDLKQQGVDLCEEHAGRKIKGDLFVESTSERISWDPIEFRHLFDQSLVIWRRIGSFEVVLDSLGRLAGFIDHDKYLTSKEGELKPEEADDLLAATGVVPKGATRTDFKGRTRRTH